uniref:NADH-ubiquinone oxidoreductase chain 3 n=1 Tax=Triops cancriformis TaxID=194544 RepID=Q8HCU6_TRICB|nr:NADH dehydrogenase subunit 3 [Triops cancriformis]QCZ36081.1 NADH dehydrogenase subunit 3 [Triops cancriformis]BAC53600.1 NADH dehydrogenase subunit 3 [Triops cancriformis]
MWLLIISLTFSFIVIIMMTAASILSKKTFSDREKSSPFECGFDPVANARMPFSLRFFMIAMIFLIFDVEIALLLPYIFGPDYFLEKSWYLGLSFFLIILLVGLYHEWKQGALDWAE